MMWHGNDEVFKTYVQGNPNGDGKKPIEKVKGRDRISTWDEVKDYDCFGGVLNDSFVDISFDSKEMYEAFLDMAESNSWKCLCLPSTHGGHTYWKNGDRIKKGGHDKRLAVGLLADIHDKSTYIPLRVHGADRFPPDYDKLDGEEYQTVPEELLPVNTTIDIWGLSDGDGRNDTIYKYILVLQKLRCGIDTIRRILQNANRFVFKTPLEDKELEIILRDEAFQKPNFYNDKGAFLFADFAQYLIATQHIVKINDILHVYRDGAYDADQEAIERTMIDILPCLRSAQRLEVIKYLRLIAPQKKAADSRYIAFRNGVYDIITEQMTDYDPDVAITNMIDLDYDPNCYSEIGDRTLNALACGDMDIRALLEECVGYCLYRRNDGHRKAFILTGGKRNGKSTFLTWLKDTLGERNISALDLKELSDRFSTAMMYGKLANIGDDIGDDFLQGSQVAMFKKIVAGNRIKAENKGLKPFEFNPYVKLLFSANTIPRMKDKTGAVLDRLIIIPFEAVFEEGSEGYDRHIYDKLKTEEARMYLLKVGMEGLKRIYPSGSSFTRSAKVEGRIHEYETENNPILGFIEDTDIEDIFNHSTSDVYTLYTVFCNKNNMNAMSNIQFSKVMCKKLGMKVINRRISGHKSRIFVKEGGTNERFD